MLNKHVVLTFPFFVADKTLSCQTCAKTAKLACRDMTFCQSDILSVRFYDKNALYVNFNINLLPKC